MADDVAGQEARAKGTSQSRVRRRNRMITSCLECRRRKLKCDKSQPCTNCIKFSRECVFLAPALDTVSQQKLNEIKDKMGSLERVLEKDVAGRKSKTSTDLPGDEGESSGGEAEFPEEERDMEPTPLAVSDAVYDDDVDDEILDIGIRVGKMRMTDRVGGLFRPKFSEELGLTLAAELPDRRNVSQEQPRYPLRLRDDDEDFLEPGPTFLPPGAGFVLGNIGSQRSLLDFLPTKSASDTLVRKYYENAHFYARVVHWPTFKLQYENFWTSVLAGLEPPASQQALVMAILFCAIVSMQEGEIAALFARPKKTVMLNFQAAVEVCLSKAQFLRSTKIETLQALVIYLIPMCRDQISKAHSVLVGTAVRLGECMGLYRDPQETYSMSPVECQVRRTLWFQLCLLDYMTCEAQGPRPAIKRADYDTRFPLNVNDIDLLGSASQETKTEKWTDMTLSRIRFECIEMWRIIWHDRLSLEKRRITLTYVLAKIESFRKAMEQKYLPMFDLTQPIQKLASLIMDFMLLRMHIMVLNAYLTNIDAPVPDRIRQIGLSSCMKCAEDAISMDTLPELSRWKWYNGSMQQWHAGLLLVTDIHLHPNRREADRCWAILDYIFDPEPSLSRSQKGKSILAAVMTRVGTYRDLRKVRAPTAAENRLRKSIDVLTKAEAHSGGMMGKGNNMNQEQLLAYRVALSPEPATANSSPSSPGEQSARRGSNQPNPPEASGFQQKTTDTAEEQKFSDWNFGSPATYFVNTSWQANAQPVPNTGNTPPQPQVPDFQFPIQPSFNFPSQDMSYYNEQWPPFVTNDQRDWSLPLNKSTSPPSMPLLSVPGMQSGIFSQSMGSTAQGYNPSDPGYHTSVNTNTSPSSMALSSPTMMNNAPYVGSAVGYGGMPGMNGMNGGHVQQAPSKPQDTRMIDINWSEWDQLFPPEINNGNLDMPLDF